MDLGIAGKKALVCGASAGLGYACAKALVQEGVHVVVVARTEGPLQEAANTLRALDKGAVDWVAADVTTAEGRGRILRRAGFDVTAVENGTHALAMLADATVPLDLLLTDMMMPGISGADLVAFGKLFIANPDLVERFRRKLPLAADDMKTWYSQGPEGYVDYPTLHEDARRAATRGSSRRRPARSRPGRRSSASASRTRR